MNPTENGNLPSEFHNVSVCSCSFYKVRNPLEYEEEFTVADKIVSCSILITKTNSLIEIENNCVKRIREPNIKNALKVIMHHEFEPFGRYIVVLTKEMTAHMLDYTTVEEINSWNNVSDISSEDLSGEGRPRLIMKKISGGCHTVTEGEFLVQQNSETQENSRAEAIIALNNKLKSIVWLAESVEAEVTRKEAFISRKISDLSSQLQKDGSTDYQRARDVELPGSMPAGSQSSAVSIDLSSTLQFNDNILKVLNTRQRIVHDKWVICVAIVNLSDRHIISSPELVLHSEKSVRCLHYRTRILKTYQRTYAATGSHRNPHKSGVNIEDLEPPILRPKKKAFLLATCDFPNFSFGNTVSCGGLITFRTRSTRPDTDEEYSIKQIPFPPAQLDARNMNPVCADVIREQGSAGFSFELFTLIAASKCHSMKVKSIASPLDQFIEAIAKDSRIIKAQGLSEFYCFYIPECPPLHLASFICKHLSANQLMLKTYTKDDNQGMILLHNLKEFLPLDAFVSVEDSQCASVDSHHGDLLLNMNLIIDKIKSAYEQKPDVEKLQEKKSKGEGSKSRTPFASFNSEINEGEYIKWRENISELSLEMEMLFTAIGE